MSAVDRRGLGQVLIADNVVGDIGRIYLQQPAIVRLKGKKNIVVEHNELHHGPCESDNS